MDWYLIAKYLHVSLAILWLGGGFILVLLGMLANRARDEEALLATIRAVVRVAPLVFVPGSVLVLGFGLAMAWLGGWDWEAWLVVGLSGIAFTALFGSFILGPMAGEVAALEAQGQRAEALARGQRLLQLARLDYLAQFTIVFAMVVKPGWTDPGLLGGMAGVMALGALMFLLPGRRPAGSAPAMR